MEVRCPGCNKLFRVSDDKIQGSGVKFGCTKCSTVVKITREDFERYQASKGPAPGMASVSSRPAPAPKMPDASKNPSKPAVTDPGLKPAAAAKPTVQPGETARDDVFDLSEPAAAAAAMGLSEPAAAAADVMDAFDLSEPAAAAAAMQEQKEEIPVFAQTVPSPPSPAPPAPKPEQKRESQPSVSPKPVPVAQTKPETAAPVKPKQEPARPPSPSGQAAAAPARESHPAPSYANTAIPRPQPPVSSGSGIAKKIAIVIIAIVIAGSLAAGAIFYLGWSSFYRGWPFQKVSDTAQQLMSPEGLQVGNPTGTIDPVSQDLIVSGTVENSTDKPKPAWLVLVEVYDAQGTVLTKARLVNGKQLYTLRDYEIMAKRGENVQDIKMKQLQNQGVPVPALSSVNFEIRIMEPPVGIASFNATLQPFDPVQLLKELSKEQK